MAIMHIRRQLAACLLQWDNIMHYETYTYCIHNAYARMITIILLYIIASRHAERTWWCVESHITYSSSFIRSSGPPPGAARLSINNVVLPWLLGYDINNYSCGVVAADIIYTICIYTYIYIYIYIYIMRYIMACCLILEYDSSARGIHNAAVD